MELLGNNMVEVFVSVYASYLANYGKIFKSKEFGRRLS